MVIYTEKPSCMEETIVCECINTPRFFREYDAFISLGSSCVVAKQLEFRDLRQYSLPFDSLIHVSHKHIQIVNKLFVSHFKDFFLYENIIPFN